MNKLFANQPSDLRGGGLDPPRPPRAPRPLGSFGLPTENPSMPPLPPNRPYRWPFNYHEYVKDFNPNAHVKVFKSAIRANTEIDDVEIVSLFNFTLEDIMFKWCNNYMGYYPDCIFAKLCLAFCKRYIKV